MPIAFLGTSIRGLVWPIGKHIMVIDPSNNGVNSSTTSSARNKAPEASATASHNAQNRAVDTGSSSDSVSLSVTAKALARLEAGIAQTPDVDEAKVNALRERIENGSYQVNPESIAENILKQDSLIDQN